MLDLQAIKFHVLPSVTLQKRSLRRSVEVLVRQVVGEAEISRSYWHYIGARQIRDTLLEDTLKED
jgi:hypothetical protein